MKLLTNPVTLLLLGLCALSVAGTYGRWGVDDLEHAEGVSLREGSRSGAFFTMFRTRVHAGGGLSGGK